MIFALVVIVPFLLLRIEDYRWTTLFDTLYVLRRLWKESLGRIYTLHDIICRGSDDTTLAISNTPARTDGKRRK